MLVFIVRRLVISFFVLLGATAVMYLLTVNAGDPLASLYEDSSSSRDAKIAQRTADLNLDQPVPVRYLTWLKGASQCAVPWLDCDLGRTITGGDVAASLGQAIGSTMRLILVATVAALLLGVMVGIVTALRQYTGLDYSITFASFLFFSLPIFWVAVLLKQFVAIRFNDWLTDPVIAVPVVVALAVVAGLLWAALLGGDRRRRLMTFAVAGAVTAAVLLYLSAERWFAYPSLGFPLVALTSVAAATGVTAITTGLRNRRALGCSLAMSFIGLVCYFALGPLLTNPTWTIMAVLVVITVAVALLCGRLFGGLAYREAMLGAVVSALFTGGLIFLDKVLTAFPDYSDAVRGRPIATVGSNTPNFDGNFWETFLDNATHLVLPTLAIILISFATYTRYTRASMLETMNQDYVRTARSKGLPERTVVLRHAFRNAMIPITTLMAFDFAGVIGGAVITERVFGWQGMGNLFATSLLNVDPNPVMAFFLVTGTIAVLFNMVADIAYAYLDPRIRL